MAAEDTQGGPLDPPPFQKFTRIYFAGVWILTVHGDLDERDKAAFRETLFYCIEGNVANPPRDVVVDLNEVTFLSEGVVAVLIHAFKIQKAQGKAVRLARPSIAVQKKLARMGLTQFFPVDE